MPIIQPGQPQVSIALPVPTPVEQKPRARPPKASSPAPVEEAPPQPVMMSPQPPPLKAVILPWTPPPQRMSRKRYGRFGYSHADFLQGILSDPHDATHVLAYADWLEENGNQGMAQILRDAMKDFNGRRSDVPPTYPLRFYTLTAFNPAQWTQYSVSPTATPGEPHAWGPLPREQPRSISSKNYGQHGIGIIWPVQPEWKHETRMFRDEPVFTGASYNFREAHKIATKMREEGVKNADKVVSNLERMYPVLTMPDKMRRRTCGVIQYAARPTWFGRSPYGVSWFQLDTFLGRRQQRAIGRNRTVWRDDNNDIHVRLHNTNVVTVHHPDNGGGYTVRTGGWNTPTTARTVGYITGRHASTARGRFTLDGEPVAEGQRIDRLQAPQPERGQLTSDQINMLTTHLNSLENTPQGVRGDLTVLGALGDSIAESGSPNTGRMLSNQTKTQYPSVVYRNLDDPDPLAVEAGEYRYHIEQTPHATVHRVSIVHPDGRGLLIHEHRWN